MPEDLQMTKRNERFYWDDSGITDPERIIIFTTAKNIELLSEYPNWLMDGTFRIIQKKKHKNKEGKKNTYFRQLYTIHVIINNKDVPLVYCCLFNKAEKQYKKLFSMLASYISKEPKTIAIDFEKAVFNAAQKQFKNCHIYGCYFHLSKAFLEKVKEKSMKEFYASQNYRSCYKLMQAIAFLPVEDIVAGFLYLKQFVTNSCISYMPVLDYFEKTYIGKLKANSQTQRLSPRFSHESWSLHERILAHLPRTTNYCESWHSGIKDTDRIGMKFDKLVEFLRVEQSNTENYLTKVKAGDEKHIKQNTLKEERYYNLCKNYKKENMIKFLEGII